MPMEVYSSSIIARAKTVLQQIHPQSLLFLVQIQVATAAVLAHCGEDYVFTHFNRRNSNATYCTKSQLNTGLVQAELVTLLLIRLMTK